MKTIIKIVALECIVSLAAAGAAPAIARADEPPRAGGPTVELPPPDAERPNAATPREPQRGIPRPPFLELPRENEIEVPLNEEPAASATAIGGYGELVVTSPSNEPTVVDMRRLVLFVGHNFTPRFRLYTELELEHAITSSEDKGEFELEQAFLDYLAWKWLNFRAGVILIPVGIINVYHEPPTFNGVDRPETDTRIIPSTWREPGIGVFGGWRGLRWQAYAVNGFNAKGFTASEGIRDGHQEAQLALGHDWGVVARVDWQPLLGLTGGMSFYHSHADQGQPEFRGSDGSSVPVTLVEADVRGRWRGLEARGEIASIWIAGTRRLNRALAGEALANGVEFDGPVGYQLLGGYVEVGYNVLQELRLRRAMQLVPFLRYEHTDTQFDMGPGLARTPGNQHDLVTVGLTFRPIAEVALKFDYQRLWTDSDVPENATVDKFNAGLGFMF
jgi:hypothetical protein